MIRFAILVFISLFLSACATTSGDNNPDLSSYNTKQEPIDSSTAAETAARM